MKKIRPFQAEDAHALCKLKFQTIRDVCIKDYSPVQVAVWAPDKYEHETWLRRLSRITPFVAVVNDEIAGYCDLHHSNSHYPHWVYSPAMKTICSLLEQNGYCAISLRHGSAGKGKYVFPTSVQEMNTLARHHGLQCHQISAGQPSKMKNKAQVTLPLQVRC